MARKLVIVVCFGVVCASVLTNYGRPSASLELVSPEVANSIVGGASGSCAWQDYYTCETGNGCAGVICGYGAFFFPCPRRPGEGPDEPLVNNPQLPGLETRFYHCYTGAAGGLTECGFTSNVSCGSIETCHPFCTPGSPLGALHPVPSRCKMQTATPNSNSSETASGDYCIVT